MLENINRFFNRYRLKDQSFAHLFEPYAGDEIVSFDCETTGLDVKNDEIITIGATLIKENKILTSQKFEVTINPGREVGRESIKIHHIRTCDISAGISTDEGIRRFVEFIQNRPLLGYYVEFDVGMINKTFKKLFGTKLPNRQIEVSALYYDKKERRIPQGNIDLSYATILKDLQLPTLGQHSAINDAIMNAMIYLKLKNIKHL